MQENGINKFSKIVSEVSSFVQVTRIYMPSELILCLTTHSAEGTDYSNFLVPISLQPDGA